MRHAHRRRRGGKCVSQHDASRCSHRRTGELQRVGLDDWLSAAVIAEDMRVVSVRFHFRDDRCFHFARNGPAGNWKSPGAPCAAVRDAVRAGSSPASRLTLQRNALVFRRHSIPASTIEW